MLTSKHTAEQAATLSTCQKFCPFLRQVFGCIDPTNKKCNLTLHRLNVVSMSATVLPMRMNESVPAATADGLGDSCLKTVGSSQAYVAS